MTMDWQGAPASPSSFTVKRILRLEIPVDTYPNVSFYTNASYRKSNLITQSYTCNKNMLLLIALVQFCWKTSGTQRQFFETGRSYYWLPCVYSRKRIDKGSRQGNEDKHNFHGIMLQNA